MKVIFRYISEYFYQTNKLVLLLVSILTGVLILMNYSLGIDEIISSYESVIRFGLWFLVFLIAFGGSWLIYHWFGDKPYFGNRRFILLVLLAPLIFSLKMVMDISFHFSHDTSINIYWNVIFYWPLLLLVTTLIIYFYWRIADHDQPFYGIKTRGLFWKPYLVMLLIMIPLIILASTQSDFLSVYPKLKMVTGWGTELPWWKKILFELSYGSDFITIELFFRGFLVLAFLKFAGKEAILPMACFYCTIHFGKPMGECISSYFGGLLLGIVVYNTRSVFGGLMVHLGIAWLMELGGYLGNL